jgi:hypothetical protein
LIWKTSCMHVPIFDATEAVMAVHQNHDYSHLGGVDKAWNGPEAIRNRELAGNGLQTRNILEADYIVTRDSLKSAWLRKRKYHIRLHVMRLVWSFLALTRPTRHKLGLRAESLAHIKRLIAPRIPRTPRTPQQRKG